MSYPEPPTIEAEADFKVEGAGKPCKTWYTVFGDLKSGVRPLVCLHGGPGAAHNYIRPIRFLASTHSIPVIMYDQLGIGNSTHLPEKIGDGKFWTVELFLAELDNLLKHLGIQDDYDLLGQSWGGMLGACHAINQPKGLHRLVIADSPASMKMWVIAADTLRQNLPPDVQATLLKHEADGTTDSPEYEAAMQVFYDRHVCRVIPKPKDWDDTEAAIKADRTVYLTMNGPSEFFITGTLKDFNIVDELSKIKVPTLLVNGKYDEATDYVMEPFWKSIEKVKWVRFAESSHTPQLEETAEFLRVVGGYLKAE
ncbi:proline-specific peptidase [Hyaloscypha bicolor E]|uniref:Proline-specific peptidase n=1 Tax=Hyaloscypha bicolor E TaxID=1095630 RepID=A0A2J6TPE7_9HELO|nr:proline-specific peptidase [Hyaloscypha bicolor E]PMD64828.1 proline-specific peptidase [Hyaloscypha bicolor E]